MNDEILKTTRTIAASIITPRVHWANAAIEIDGQHLTPDATKAYVDFTLSHGFPVRTADGTAIHPQVVANSFRSLHHQVFNLGHLMKAYESEDNPITRDRILGSIVGVEFPKLPLGDAKWKVQKDRSKSPGIRAAAVLHKKAEGADRIIGLEQSGRRKWSVSMEADYTLLSSGFAVRIGDGVRGLASGTDSKTRDAIAQLQKEWPTPKDLLDMGYVYVSALKAPEKLLDCLDMDAGAIKKDKAGNNMKWAMDGAKLDVILLIGGIDGTIHYKGTGMCPLGTQKEDEAKIAQMLASGWGEIEDVSGSVGEPEDKTVSGSVGEPVSENGRQASPDLTHRPTGSLTHGLASMHSIVNSIRNNISTEPLQTLGIMDDVVKNTAEIKKILSAQDSNCAS